MGGRDGRQVAPGRRGDLVQGAGRRADNPPYAEVAPHFPNRDEAVVPQVRIRKELAAEDKGGATLDGQLMHELPPAYFELQRQLRQQLAL